MKCCFIYNTDTYVVGNICIYFYNTQESLNNGQKEVVLKASYVAVTDKPGIYLIKGPPGSGKSTVISSIIQQLLFRKQKSGQRILLISPSSVALDSLVLRLTKTRASLPGNIISYKLYILSAYEIYSYKEEGL